VSEHKLLFVCLGNICRSPLAEGIFIHLAREADQLHRFEIDSAGTGGWHAGNPADPRSIQIAAANGVELPSRARQYDASDDPERFTLILAMDRQNERDLLDLGTPREKVRLMRSFDPELAGAKGSTLDVPDPYYGGDDGFRTVYEMLDRACRGLLEMF